MPILHEIFPESWSERRSLLSRADLSSTRLYLASACAAMHKPPEMAAMVVTKDLVPASTKK